MNCELTIAISRYKVNKLWNAINFRLDVTYQKLIRNYWRPYKLDILIKTMKWIAMRAGLKGKKCYHYKEKLLFTNPCRQTKVLGLVHLISFRRTVIQSCKCTTKFRRSTNFLTNYNLDCCAQGQTKWRNCRLSTETPDYQLGWAVLAASRLICFELTLMSQLRSNFLVDFLSRLLNTLKCNFHFFLKILPTLPVNINALSIYRSKLILDRPNCFGRVQISLIRFKLGFSGLFFIIRTCQKWFGPNQTNGTHPKQLVHDQNYLDGPKSFWTHIRTSHKG